ncbi:MAG: hypothetical protein Q4G26_02630, partial [Paracoccus sp. (in: a-proteobacteria)]|nr:hypothetical protein [Paracoccus sp. (in: a-proteobacteria)]
MRKIAAMVGVSCIFKDGLRPDRKSIGSMTDGHIQALAALSGQGYLARRNEFLASAPPLSNYPFDLGHRDPRYRVQYLILMGWQRNADLFRQIEDRL